MNRQELIEQLADKEHASWAHWMDYLFSRCKSTINGDVVIPCELALRWRRQADTSYAELSEQEKQSDRDEVAHIMPFIDEYAAMRWELNSLPGHQIMRMNLDSNITQISVDEQAKA